MQPDYRSPACAREGCNRRSDALYFPRGLGSAAYTLCPRHESDDWVIWLYGARDADAEWRDSRSLDQDMGGWLRRLDDWYRSLLVDWLRSPAGQRWMRRGDGTRVTR